MHPSLLIATFLAASTSAFVVVPSSSSARGTHLTASSSSSDDDLFADPYADMLDFKRAIAPDIVSPVLELSSIAMASDDGAAPLTWPGRSPRGSRLRREPWWDAFMEEQFHDMDDDVVDGDDQKWLLDVRDEVEKKRGFAIWSKRSNKEVQREAKKALASKAVKVPEPVATVVRLVYLEKVRKMSQLKKDPVHELAAIAFRKWMIEQKKKGLKDPLLLAKIEVAQQWLQRPPSAFAETYPRNHVVPPPVVMDEITDADVAAYRTVGANDAAAGAAVFGVKVPPADSSSKAAGPCVTASMAHWNTARGDLPDALTADCSEAARAARREAALRVSDGAKGVFYVDGEEMFVATQLASLTEAAAAAAAATLQADGSPIVDVPTEALLPAASAAVSRAHDADVATEFYVVL